MDFVPHGSSDDYDCPTYRPRRNDRLRVDVATTMRGGDDQTVDVRVCDISTAGFMAECMRPVLIGSFVALDMPGVGAVRAQVRWQVGGRLGGKFVQAVSLDACDWLPADR